MTQQIVTRRQAKDRGSVRYYPGSACKRGHVAERITRNGSCTVCAKVRASARDRTDEYRKLRTPVGRARQRQYMSVWRETNRAKMRAYHREYQRVRRSDPAVRKQENADIRRRRNADPAAIQRNRAVALAWAKRNPDKRADILMRRKARLRAAFVEHVPRVEVFERDDWRCQICKSRVSRTARVPHPKAATVDHIVPLSRGGKHERGNLQCACYACNCKKGNRAADDQLLVGI